MPHHGLPIEENARVRSRIALVGGCMLLVFATAEALRGAPDFGIILAARLAWAGALFVSARLLARPSRLTEPLVDACFLVSIVALAVIDVNGGARTAARVYLVVAPIFFALLVPDAIRSIVFASAVTGAAVVTTRLLTGGGAWDAGMDLLRAASSGALAVLGAFSAGKVRAAEIALAEDRARALEALAASQQRQLEVEQLAAAGTKAASCAHDMSNPLASMRCNLDWLREAAEQDRLEADRDEVLEVIQETRECLAQLGHQLQDFRTIARTARAHARQLEALPGASAPVRALPDRAAGE